MSAPDRVMAILCGLDDEELDALAALFRGLAATRRGAPQAPAAGTRTTPTGTTLRAATGGAA